MTKKDSGKKGGSGGGVLPTTAHHTNELIQGV